MYIATMYRNSNRENANGGNAACIRHKFPAGRTVALIITWTWLFLGDIAGKKMYAHPSGPSQQLLRQLLSGPSALLAVSV